MNSGWFGVNETLLPNRRLFKTPTPQLKLRPNGRSGRTSKVRLPASAKIRVSVCTESALGPTLLPHILIPDSTCKKEFKDLNSMLNGVNFALNM